MRMRIILGAAIGAACLALAACGPTLSQLYTESAPFEVAACNMPASDLDAPTRSYAAMMKTLAEQKWRFDEIAPQQGRLKASLCRRTLCVTMIFLVRSDGAIAVHADPAAPMYTDMDGYLIKWMRNFDQRFSNFRCMARDVAIQTLKQYGAVQ